MKSEENYSNEPETTAYDVFEPTSTARADASLRMLALVPGVLLGMWVGVTLNSIVVGAIVGIALGVGAALLLDFLRSRTNPR